MDECTAQARSWIESEEPLELSFIELVVAATELSEDESEIFDLVDGVLDEERFTLVPVTGA